MTIRLKITTIVSITAMFSWVCYHACTCLTIQYSKYCIELCRLIGVLNKIKFRHWSHIVKDLPRVEWLTLLSRVNSIIYMEFLSGPDCNIIVNSVFLLNFMQLKQCSRFIGGCQYKAFLVEHCTHYFDSRQHHWNFRNRSLKSQHFSYMIPIYSYI